MVSVAVLSAVVASSGVAWAREGVVSFVDRFEGDLSSWQVMDGSWSISGGKLQGDYDISCGSPSCPQGAILLQEAYQPRTLDWRVDVTFFYTQHLSYDLYQATVLLRCTPGREVVA